MSFMRCLPPEPSMQVSPSPEPQSLNGVPSKVLPAPDRVEALARLTSRELEAQFLRATIADSDFLAISGHPRGRVLAIPGLDRGLVGDAVRRFQGSVLY